MTAPVAEPPGVSAEPLSITIPGCVECVDLWTWVVLYRDGSQLLECRGDSQRHAAYKDIDLEQVQAMALLPLHDGLPQLTVKMSSPDMRPIFFRRHYVEINPELSAEVGRQTIHCLGYQLGSNEHKTAEHYTFVFPDGSILLTNDRQAV